MKTTDFKSQPSYVHLHQSSIRAPWTTWPFSFFCVQVILHDPPKTIQPKNYWNNENKLHWGSLFAFPAHVLPFPFPTTSRTPPHLFKNLPIFFFSPPRPSFWTELSSWAFLLDFLFSFPTANFTGFLLRRFFLWFWWSLSFDSFVSSSFRFSFLFGRWRLCP